MTDTILLDNIKSINLHITVINDELGVVCTRLAVLESQMDDIQWLGRLILGSIILSLIGSILSFVWVKKNTK